MTQESDATGTPSQSDASAQQAARPQDIGSFLQRPLTLTAPTWAFALAAFGALILVGVAFD